MNIHPDEWFKTGPYTIFDLETTGLSPINNRIIEIAAIKIDLSGQISKFHSLVNPECPIPENVSSVHGITDELVKFEKTFDTIGKEFLNFASGTILVAHNAKFDLAFLQESLHRKNLPLWDGKTIDSTIIIKSAYPGLPSYALQKLRHFLNLGNGNEPAHRAYADVTLTFDAFTKAMKKLLSYSVK